MMEHCPLPIDNCTHLKSIYLRGPLDIPFSNRNPEECPRISIQFSTKRRQGNYKRSRFEIGNARVSFQSFMATIVITTTIKALNIMCFLPSKKEIAGAALYA